MRTNEVVLEHDAAAATPHTMTGWLSRHGHFYYGSAGEYLARRDGCTHTLCSSCLQPIAKGWLQCPSCRDALDLRRYLERQRVPWNGVAMLYDEASAQYYHSPADAFDTRDDDVAIRLMRLRVCEPVYARQLDPDFFIDALPEDGDLPLELCEAVSAYNAAVEAVGPLSWQPGPYALQSTEQADGM